MENSRNQWSDLTLTNMIRREGGGRGVETVVAVASRTQTEYIIAPSPPYHYTASVVSHGNHNSCCSVG